MLAYMCALSVVKQMNLFSEVLCYSLRLSKWAYPAGKNFQFSYSAAVFLNTP